MRLNGVDAQALSFGDEGSQDSRLSGRISPEVCRRFEVLGALSGPLPPVVDPAWIRQRRPLGHSQLGILARLLWTRGLRRHAAALVVLAVHELPGPPRGSIWPRRSSNELCGLEWPLHSGKAITCSPVRT